ncbi:MAG: LacI family DNA-binding transcriptional regulator [bacterium]
MKAKAIQREKGDLKIQRRVTLADIAKELNLDKSSVSLALRGHLRVSAETRARVLTSAQRLGYRVNAAAQQLATGKSHALGLVLPGTFATLRVEVAMRTIERLATLVAAGGKAFTILSASDLILAAHDPMALPHPEGVFVWGDVPLAALSDAGLRNTPSVVLDPNHVSYADYRGLQVAMDNKGVGRMMVEHLVSRGVQRLLFVQANTDHLGHLQRWDGARQAWGEHRPPQNLTCAPFAEVNDNLLRTFATGGDGGILCVVDDTAVVLMRRLTQMGFRIPQDIRIAGINGEEPARLMEVTTALFDAETLAEKAYQALSESLTLPPVTTPPPIPFTLKVGETT